MAIYPAVMAEPLKLSFATLSIFSSFAHASFLATETAESSEWLLKLLGLLALVELSRLLKLPGC